MEWVGLNDPFGLWRSWEENRFDGFDEEGELEEDELS